MAIAVVMKMPENEEQLTIRQLMKYLQLVKRLMLTGAEVSQLTFLMKLINCLKHFSFLLLLLFSLLWLLCGHI